MYTFGKCRVDPQKKTFFKKFDNSHNTILALKNKAMRPVNIKRLG